VEPDMPPPSPLPDPAIPILTMDILSQILSRVDNPKDLGLYLAEEIRELTGARCILLIRRAESPDVTSRQILTVHPERKREWAESQPVIRFLQEHYADISPCIWSDDSPVQIPDILSAEGYRLSISIPLCAGEQQAGVLYALGLPDTNHVQEVIDLLSTISSIVALVLRNASLYEEQDLIIEQRTAELQSAYEEIRCELEERRKIEDTLRSTNAYLESLITSANVPIIVWDTTFCITRVNRAFEDLIGRASSELLGSGLEILFPPSLVERSMRLIRTTLQGVRWETVELDILRSDGSIRTLVWNSATIYDQDEVTALATIAQGQDITHQKRLEREKDAAIEQIQKNLGQLSVLNDEIRNPLTVMSIAVDMMEDDSLQHMLLPQIQRIDDMITGLDTRWMESDKVLQFLRKHYTIHSGAKTGSHLPSGSHEGDGTVPEGHNHPEITLRSLYIEEVQAELYTILDSIDALIYVADMDTYEIIYINRRGRTTFGSIAGQKCYTSLHNYQSAPCPFCTNPHLVDGDTPTGVHTWEYQNSRNGRWYECRDRAIQWSDGRLVRLQIATDITERKQVHEELKQSLETFHEVVRLLPTGIYIYEWHDPDKLVLIDGNDEAEKIAGIRTKDWIGREFNEIWPAAKDAGITDTYLQVLKTGIPYETEEIAYTDLRISGAFRIRTFRIPNSRIVVAFENISERKKAEEALRLKEVALDSSLTAIVMCDLQGNLNFVNQAFVRMWGYETPDEVIGRPISSFCANEQKTRDALAEVREIGWWSGELSAICHDGSSLVIFGSCNLVRNSESIPIAIYGSFIDITRQKAMEEDIKHHEAEMREKLRAILSPVGDISTLSLSQILDVPAIQSLMDDFYSLTGIGVGMIDLNGTVLVGTGWQEICTRFHRTHPDTRRYCHESDITLTEGIHPGEFRLYQCKNHMWDIATPIIIGGVHMGNLFLGQFLFEDEVPDYELFKSQALKYGFEETAYIAALDKVPRWSRNTVEVVMKFYTKLVHLISEVCWNNISLARMAEQERKQTDSLRKAEDDFRDLANSITEILIVLDLDLNVVFWNREAAKFSGVAHQDARGKSLFSLFPHSFQVDQIKDEIIKVLITRKPKIIEIEATHHGQKIYLEKSIYPASRGLLILIRDISARKKLEEGIAESIAKHQLLSGITRHDIVNQLTTATLLINLAEQHNPDSDANRYLHNALSSLEQITAILDFTHEYERIGSLTSRWQPLYLTVRMACDETRVQGITIKVEIPRELEIFADPLLKKVFMTLIDNAIRHGEGITQICFFIGKVRDSLVVVCEDDGIGIPADEKERIFDHGYGKNTGFGLFLARQVLMLTGLSITEVGDEGTGARFEIHIPAGKYRNVYSK
jgi:PAS domain S-box-containing protein